jgi:hypothetical protein
MWWLESFQEVEVVRKRCNEEWEQLFIIIRMIGQESCFTLLQHGKENIRITKWKPTAQSLISEAVIASNTHKTVGDRNWCSQFATQEIGDNATGQHYSVTFWLSKNIERSYNVMFGWIPFINVKIKYTLYPKS